MIRICKKLQLHRDNVKVSLDIHIYDDGTILLEDYSKDDYYQFDSILECSRFISLNYETKEF